VEVVFGGEGDLGLELDGPAGLEVEAVALGDGMLHSEDSVQDDKWGEVGLDRGAEEGNATGAKVLVNSSGSGRWQCPYQRLGGWRWARRPGRIRSRVLRKKPGFALEVAESAAGGG
jgi:hypothetical protein